ncbi:MAG: hypothetical protein PUP92_03965 [Rhizonema sp. PD38]|nr:hypothetical protein [Rhizonema sp. PD38]
MRKGAQESSALTGYLMCSKVLGNWYKVFVGSNPILAISNALPQKAIATPEEED